VQGKHGANIDSKKYQIIAVETITQNTYAIISPNRGEELSGIMMSFILIDDCSLD